MSEGADPLNPVAARVPVATLPRIGRWSALAALGVLALLFAWMLIDGTPPWSRAPLPENPTKKAALAYHLGNGLWQAAAFGLAVIGLLLATSRWWMVRGAGVLAGAGDVSGKFFLYWIAPIVLLALIVRVPLLDHSLYGDEHYTITRFIHGEQRLTKEGGTQFREIEWKQTIWGYQRPNNHIFFSIIARATHTAWQKAAGANAEDINVPVLRVPAMVAAVLSIAVAAWILWSHGFRTGAVVAALLMALHPWHIAHSVEVRGYGFVFLFLLTSVHFALASMRTGRWLHWAGLAASQFCLLHTYPKAILIAGPTSAALLVVLLMKARRDPSRASLLPGPFLATQAMMSVALAFAYLPCLPQLGEYFDTVAPKGGMEAGWAMDVASLFLAGRYWQAWEPLNALCRSLAHEAAALPWIVFPLLALFALAGFRGAWKICRARPWLALMLTPMVLSIPLALAKAQMSGAYLYTWYMIMPLPLWLMCVGVGVETANAKARPPALAYLLPVIAILAFLHLSSPQRKVIARFPAEPINETYASLLEHLSGFEGSSPSIYAMAALVDFHSPEIRKLRGENDLLETISKYQASGSPFFLILPGLHSIRENNPRVAEALESSGRFRLLARHHGIEFAHRSYDLWIFGENATPAR
jgi:hypothetical protein